MTIITPHWKRKLKIKAYSFSDQKTLIEILEPLREKGIKTLRVNKSLWNYFPKIRRTIEVPASVMTGAWMGSDFSNDDLVKQASLAEDYHLDLFDLKTQWKVKLVPKEDLPTVWGHIEILIEKNSLLPLKQTYFDEEGIRKRVLSFSKVKDFSGKKLPSQLLMKNLSKKGYQTIMHYQNINFKPDFSENIFVPEKLQSKNLR